MFHKLLQYKIFHILFWILYTLYLYHTIAVPNKADFFSYKILSYLFNNLISRMLVIYFATYYIIPKYFSQKKYWKMGLGILLAMCLGTILNSILDVLLINKTMPTLRKNVVMFVVIFVDFILPTFTFLSIVIIYKTFHLLTQNHLKEKQILQLEIDLLQGQMKPHFLFNALNSIYVLMQSDTKKASEMLLKFSDLLRHQVYSKKNELVPIKSEIQFLEEYIAIEKMRKEKNLEVVFEHKILNYNHLIAPLLLQPLLENAFKYVSTELAENFIHINLLQLEEKISIIITNSFVKKSVYRNNGIGINNVKRRLQLIYPNKHQFAITENESQYQVHLTIEY